MICPGPFQIGNLLQLLKNPLCQDSSVSHFEKARKGKLKMVSVHYPKWPDLVILSFE